MFLRYFSITLVVAMCCCSAVSPAQQQKPELTDAQRLKLQNAMQQVEITQLRMALAQREADQARQEAQALLKTLIVEGWSLDLSTMTYVKKAPVK